MTRKLSPELGHLEDIPEELPSFLCKVVSSSASTLNLHEASQCTRILTILMWPGMGRCKAMTSLSRLFASASELSASSSALSDWPAATCCCLLSLSSWRVLLWLPCRWWGPGFSPACRAPTSLPAWASYRWHPRGPEPPLCSWRVGGLGGWRGPPGWWCGTPWGESVGWPGRWTRTIWRCSSSRWRYLVAVHTWSRASVSYQRVRICGMCTLLRGGTHTPSGRISPPVVCRNIQWLMSRSSRTLHPGMCSLGKVAQKCWRDTGTHRSSTSARTCCVAWDDVAGRRPENPSCLVVHLTPGPQSAHW